MAFIISLNLRVSGNLKNMQAEINKIYGIPFIAQERIRIAIMRRCKQNLSEIPPLKYTSAPKSALIIANSIVRNQIGGSATSVSKQMFIKVRKKNAVRSIKTMKHSKVSNRDHSYKPSLLAACDIILSSKEQYCKG
jgi:hypothetical protein